jgi:hypothetical protein
MTPIASLIISQTVGTGSIISVGMKGTEYTFGVKKGMKVREVVMG